MKVTRCAPLVGAILVAAACSHTIPSPAAQVAAPAAPAHAAAAHPSGHGMTMAPAIDLTRLPVLIGGRSEVAIHDDGTTFEAPPVGAFRTSCDQSHMASDDPIVAPNQPGAAHLHTFFGNAGLNASTTAESLATTGASTCDGGIVNRSGYWIPSVVDTTSGVPIDASKLVVYYKSGYSGVRKDQITAPPAGLRMIAGSGKATAAAPQDVATARWICSSARDAWTAGINTSCGAGGTLIAEVMFPQCWDGVNLDSPDHASHMAYAKRASGCPASHPVAIPEITYMVHYPVPLTGVAAWRLSSDNYTGGAGGHSLHADWFNGWDRTILDTWIRNCTRNFDCQSNFLGDGRRLTE